MGLILLIVILVLVCGGGGGYWMGGRYGSSWGYGGGVGIILFVVFAAPVVPFQHRLLMYYGYLPHFGLSLALASAIAWVVRRVGLSSKVQALQAQG